MDDKTRHIFTDTLITSASGIGVPLSDAQVSSCVRYAELLLETNTHTNLTRITGPDAMAVKHFADSLTVLRLCTDLPEGARVVDVGTGAGFPGLVLKIVRPDLRITLLDSLNKRLLFLESVAHTLNLKSVTLLHARAEEAGRLEHHRDQYDLVTARAVAALPTLLEWCAPLVGVGGYFVAMKTENITPELKAALPALPLLHLRLERDLVLTLPPVATDSAEESGVQNRRLLLFRKTAPTPERFPRRSAEIKERPLGNAI